MLDRNTTRTLALSALLTLTAACSASPPPRLAVDPAMDSAETFAVTGMKNRHWGKPLSFGPFHTEKTRVGESWSWSAGLFEHVGLGARHEPYRFRFVDPSGERHQVECRSKTPILRRSTRHGSWTFPLGDTKLSCAIQDPAGNVHSLALHGTAGDFRGETGFADLEDFEIGTLRRLVGENGFAFSLPSAFGYELRQGGQVVATVDMFNQGVVYLDRGLDTRQRTVAAITLTILMFFEAA